MPIEKMPGTEVTVERAVEGVMRDGTVLRADVYRPAGAAAAPVLLSRTPYDRHVNVSTFGNAHPAWYARHGYMVVVQDVRGRHSSDGDFTPFLHEMEDGHDSVEWAASLPGSNGDVGMFGFSYVGATQLLAAVTRPPSLRAIAPAFTGSQYYDGWTYRGGAFSLAFACYWATLLAAGTATRAGDRSAAESLLGALGSSPSLFWALPVSEYPPLMGEHASFFADWVEHHRYDEYWKRWSIDEDYGRITVPALHVGGWYDIFVSGTVANFTGLVSDAGDPSARSAQKLVVGPWTHMPWTPMGRERPTGPSTNEIDEWHLRFFDEVLAGRDTGVFESPVTAYLVDGDRRDFDGWPAADGTEWFLHSDGRANSKYGDGRLDRTAPGDEPPDVFVSDPGVPIPSQGGHSCCFDSITPMGPADQHAAEVSRMMLVYTSEPLTTDVEMIGDADVVLHVASTASDTDITARLCVVDPDGTSMNLAEGILRLRHRNSYEREELLVPGEILEITVDLGPVGAAIPAGTRLRLDISGSDFPQWDRNLNTGGRPLHEDVLAARPATQTLLHDTAHHAVLRLPIV